MTELFIKKNRKQRYTTVYLSMKHESKTIDICIFLSLHTRFANDHVYVGKGINNESTL